MAAESKVTINISITGLGSEIQMKDVFLGTTPAEATKHYRILAVADTAEALDLGGISTVQGICIKAVSGGIYIDTSFVAAFVNELTIAEGQTAYFKPAGIVYVKNITAAATPSYEYIVFGT